MSRFLMGSALLLLTGCYGFVVAYQNLARCDGSAAPLVPARRKSDACHHYFA
jgi:hypothetical protein